MGDIGLELRLDGLGLRLGIEKPDDLDLIPEVDKAVAVHRGVDRRDADLGNP